MKSSIQDNAGDNMHQVKDQIKEITGKVIIHRNAFEPVDAVASTINTITK